MNEIDKIYESLLFSIPKNNLGTEYKYGFQQGIALFKKAIDNSTVSSGQMRKKGKWIVISEFEDCCYAKCNQCKVTQIFYYGKPLTNFCPNCGADMRGEKHETN